MADADIARATIAKVQDGFSVSVFCRLRFRTLDGRGSGCDGNGGVLGEVPGQQIGDLVDRVVGDAAEEIAQIGLGVETVELGGFNQRVKRRCAVMP